VNISKAISRIYDHGMWSGLGCFDFLVVYAIYIILHVKDFLILNAIFNFQCFDSNGFVDAVHAVSDSGMIDYCYQHGM
jgi:hypothetical protein